MNKMNEKPQFKDNYLSYWLLYRQYYL